MYPQLKKVPIDQLCEILHQSKTQVYKLVDANLITPYYFTGGFTKPYFDLEEVDRALQPEIGGGVKRRTYNRKEQHLKSELK